MNSTSAVLPIAVQLYSLRTLPNDIAATLDKLAAVGYTAVETIGDHGLTADTLRGLLDQYQIQVIASHLPLERLRDDLPAVIAFNKAIGNDTLVAPYIPALVKEHDRNGYTAVGHMLGDIGRRCRDAGMRLLYHNHHWELRPIDGQLGLEWLLQAAGADSLDLELDLAWIAAAGLEPAMLLQQYAGRCPRVHVKDLAPSGERPEDAVMDGVVMADVGQGTLDWPTLLPVAHRAGVEWYIVEHDNPHDPVASVACSLAYLRQQLPAALRG